MKKRLWILWIAFAVSFTNGAFGQCNWTANNLTGCQGFELNASDVTTGASNTTWTIYLPPPANPSVFTASGTTVSEPLNYSGTVCVVMHDIVNGQPCTDSLCNVTVYPNPKIEGAFSTNVSCVGDCVYWRDSSNFGAGNTHSQWTIDWNNSQPLATSPDSCAKFPSNGSYSVAMVIENSFGCTADTTFSNVITVTAPPSAAFTGTPLNSCASPLVSTMTVTSPVPNARYSWYISSNCTFSSTPNQQSGATTFTYSYPAGTFCVKLVALDTLSGCEDSVTQVNYVTAGTNAAACFTAPDTSGCSENSYTFTPCSSAQTYDWTVSGGVAGSYTIPGPQPYTQQIPISIYFNDPGRYKVCLITGYTAGGCLDTLCRMVNLGQYVNLSFTSPDTSSCELPTVACVTYTGTACPTCNFTWSPPGNSTPNSPTGTCYTLTAYGQYTPILNVTDSFGCQAQLEQTNYISVEPLQACAQVSSLHGSRCALDTIVVTNCSPGGPFSNVTWSFPGATIVSENNAAATVIYPSTGCNDFTLAILSAQGCVDTLRDSICVASHPSVGMSVNPTALCFESLPNQFVLNISPGDTPSMVTIWPEGIAAGTPTVINGPPLHDTLSYTYPSFGNFAVCYLAETQGCLGDTVCLSSSADSVHIWPPSAKFRAIYSCQNTDTVIFVNESGDATSFYWQFNGNNYPNLDTLYAVFPQCGVPYPVGLTATNDTFGCSVPYWDSTASLPCYGIDFAFTATSGCFCNFDPEAYIFKTAPNNLWPTNVVWSTQFANVPPLPVFNPPSESGDTVPSYDLCAPRVYDACVQLKYANGCIDTLCKAQYIDISLPQPSFTLSDSAGCVPVCVAFTNTSGDEYGVLTSYTWNFGDGSPPVTNTTGANVNHCFDTIGLFNVCLIVTDTNGCTAQYCKTVQANIIHASFVESDTITCTQNPSPLNPITFTSTSTGFVSSYTWILPPSAVPATASNSQSITEQFSTQGDFQIGLIATDQYGACVDTAWGNISVLNPVANYTLSNLNDTFLPCPPLIIDTVIDLSQNNICSWSWTFGDGSNVDNAHYPGHIWTYPGTYPISECVTSCHGCVACDTAYTIVIGGPILSMTASVPQGGCPCLPVSFYITSSNCDSMQFSSNGGYINGNPQIGYINFHVNPGTVANPTIDTVNVLYCQVGNVLPSIVAIGTGSCSVNYDSLIIPIPIDTPVTSFSYTHGSCGSDSVCFTNLTTFALPEVYDSINFWTFGDGTTSNAYSPCHKFPGPGNYTVTLLVIDNLDCSDSVSMNIHIAATPTASISTTDSVGCDPFLASFTDSITEDDSTTITSAVWTFGDGGTANNAPGTITHNYTTGGNYNVTLIVTDGFGCSDTANQSVQVLAAIAISTTPSVTICFGDTGTLTGSGSGTPVWLTDYNISDTSSLTPQVWPANDTFYVFRAGGGAGCYAYDTEYVYVSTITITEDTATALCENEPTVFTAGAQSTHATAAFTYGWSFGDGSHGSVGQTVTHQYASYGTYEDTLTVTNSLGCKDMQVSPVTIYDIPHAAVGISVDSVCLGGSVTITNLSTAGVSAALTTFVIDPGTASLPDYTTSPVTVDYTAASHYTITVVQTDANQCVDSASVVFVVHALPQAGINFDTISCINVDNTYTSTTIPGDGPITYYDWTVNGVDQGIDSPSIQYTFTAIGTYPICLNVQDVYGCVDTICSDQDIVTSPVDTISPMDTTICFGYSATVQVTGLLPGAYVQWVPSVWVSNPNGDSVVISPQQTIRYQVYSYYLSCVPKVDTVTIWVIDTVPVTATADPQNIVLGLSSNVTSTVQGTIDSIVWAPDTTLNCRNCPNPIATPTQTTTYYATIYYSMNGVTCSNTTSVTITVYQSCNNSQIFVPNTFTPNNDGVDDVFRLRGQGITSVNYFRVFDRWGKMVYDATNVGDPDLAAWNGGLNNDISKPENSGVFMYVFEIQCVTGQTVSGKGNVTLLR